MLAAELEKYSEIIQKYNINISSIMTINGENILHIAARKNNVELINYLINNNFDINSRDKNGNTALFYAISSAGPNINWEVPFFENNTSFYVNTLSVQTRGDPGFPNIQAQRERSDKIINTIRILCENGIELNAQNNLGWTALHLSYVKYSRVIRELLINYGANTYIKTRFGRLPEEFKIN